MRRVVLLYVLLCLFCVSTSVREHGDKLSSPLLAHMNQQAIDPATLFRALPSVLRNAYHSSSNLFPYYDSAVASQSAGFAAEYNVADLHPPSIVSPTAGSFAYYSGNVMHDSFAELRRKLNLSTVVKNIVKDQSILSQLSPNVWIGGAGVTASTHYDSVHNIYIHFAGVKTIRLVPPSEVHILQMHGRLHPYACQSRVRNLQSGETFARPLYCISRNCTLHSVRDDVNHFRRKPSYTEHYLQNIVEYTLYPGDVLFIPPFWFHEVHSHTPSLSVSLWWDATELDTMDRIYALPLPFESSWSAAHTVVAAQVFVSMLVEAVEAEVGVTLHHALLSRTGTSSDADNLATQFTADKLLRLLKIRYAEDWGVGYGDGETEEQSNGIENKAATALLSNNTSLTHMQDNALQRARIFTAGFMHEHNYINSSAVDLNFTSTVRGDSSSECTDTTDNDRSECTCIGDETAEGTCRAQQQHRRRADYDQPVPANEDAAFKMLENQLAVLSTKLCDYIEDVFHHVAGVVIQQRSFVEENVYSRNINAVAVRLLLDWVAQYRQIGY